MPEWKRLILTLAGVLLAAPLPAQSPQRDAMQRDPLLEHLIGRWVLRGPMAGKAAMWLDNTDYNAFYPAGVGHAVAAADSIPFVFTASATDHFHNTFVYDRATDTWAWHMDNDDARGRRPFARVTLVRAARRE